MDALPQCSCQTFTEPAEDGGLWFYQYACKVCVNSFLTPLTPESLQQYLTHTHEEATSGQETLELYPTE
jgi:hypothetical protein